MKRYRRIMSGRERQAILRDERIAPSNSSDWMPFYQPGTVVFLFDLTSADLRLVSKIPQLHYDTHGETWTLEFDSDILTESDISQGGWSGASVFRGTILCNQISNVKWIPFSPSA